MIWMGELELNFHILPWLYAHSNSREKIFEGSNATFEKMQSTSPMHFGKRHTLNRKQGQPPKVVLVHAEPICEASLAQWSQGLTTS